MYVPLPFCHSLGPQLIFPSLLSSPSPFIPLTYPIHLYPHLTPFCFTHPNPLRFMPTLSCQPQLSSHIPPPTSLSPSPSPCISHPSSFIPTPFLIHANLLPLSSQLLTYAHNLLPPHHRLLWSQSVRMPNTKKGRHMSLLQSTSWAHYSNSHACRLLISFKTYSHQPETQ